MGLFKVLGGLAAGVGAIVAAPIVLPAAAALASAAAATGAVATAGSAIAGTAIGGAATTAAATVGGAVGSAAGAVGLTSVAAATGTTAGAAAVGTITTSVAVGGAAGISAKSKLDEANRIIEDAKEEYQTSKEKYEDIQAKTKARMKKLAIAKKSVAEKLQSFDEIFKLIKNPSEFGIIMLLDDSGKIVDPGMNFDGYGITMPDLSKMILKSFASGNLAGVALTGGITSTITSAGTGVAMSSLSGAAATNATMAALGGGTIASGGLGMAGGAILAKGLVFAPALAIGGLFLNSKAGEAVENAHQVRVEAEKNIANMKESGLYLQALSKCMNSMRSNINETLKVFEKLWDKLYKIVYVDNHLDAAKMSKQEKIVFFAAIGLAMVMQLQTTKQFIKEKISHETLKATDVISLDEIKKFTYKNEEIASFSKLPNIPLVKLVEQASQ